MKRAVCTVPIETDAADQSQILALMSNSEKQNLNFFNQNQSRANSANTQKMFSQTFPFNIIQLAIRTPEPVYSCVDNK